MKKFMLAAVTGLILLVSDSCAPVNFYSDSDLSKKTGLKYYTSKPYLQVEREQSSNNVVKATVLYLPDLSEPVYLVTRDGLGSRKIDLKLTDGTISTLGIATDPKIAETLEGFASLIAKSASAAGDLSTLKGLPPTAAPAVVTELYEILITKEGTSLKKIDVK